MVAASRLSKAGRLFSSGHRHGRSRSLSSGRLLPRSGLGRMIQQHPFKLSVLAAVAKTQIADLLLQLKIENKPHIDWRRFGMLSLFGLVYSGGFQYFLYNRLMPLIFPRAVAFTRLRLKDKFRDIRGIFQLFGQLFVDLGIHIPFVYMPTCYTFKEFVKVSEGEPGSLPTGTETKGSFTAMARGKVSKAFSTYRKNFKEDWLAALKIWLPINTISFGVVHMHLRIAFMSLCSLGWLSVIVLMREPTQKTEAAKRVSAQLPPVQEILDRLRQLHANFANANDQTIHRQGFKRAMSGLGITDDSALESLFSAVDLDGDGHITFAEFSSTLFLMSPEAAGEEQMKFLHSVLDLDGNGVIEKQEMRTMLVSILKGRETLAVSTFSEEEGLRAISLMSMPMRSINPETDREHVRRERLLGYRSKGGKYESCQTLAECIYIEADGLTEAIFDQADKNNDQVITIDEFSEWYSSDTREKRTVRDLFAIFSADA